jgi:hypothetical protein
MTAFASLDARLGAAAVDAQVFALRPDYRAVLLAVDGIWPGPGDAASEALLGDAESSAQSRSRMSRRGATRTGHSAPSRSAPATAWRHCFAGPRPGCRG